MGFETRLSPPSGVRSYLTDPQPGHAFVYVATIQRLAVNILGRRPSSEPEGLSASRPRAGQLGGRALRAKRSGAATSPPRPCARAATSRLLPPRSPSPTRRRVREIAGTGMRAAALENVADHGRTSGARTSSSSISSIRSTRSRMRVLSRSPWSRVRAWSFSAKCWAGAATSTCGGESRSNAGSAPGNCSFSVESSSSCSRSNVEANRGERLARHVRRHAETKPDVERLRRPDLEQEAVIFLLCCQEIDESLA